MCINNTRRSIPVGLPTLDQLATELRSKLTLAEQTIAERDATIAELQLTIDQIQQNQEILAVASGKIRSSLYRANRALGKKD